MRIPRFSNLIVGVMAAFCWLVVTNAQPAPDLRLWFDAPATNFTQSLPLGNGRLGAMVFGGVGEERIVLNESSLWSGGPQDADRPDAAPRVDTPVDGLLFTLRPDAQWQSDRPLTERARVSAAAWLQHRHGPRRPVVGLRDLVALPPATNPRTMQWAAELRLRPSLAEAGARELSQAVLEHIRTAGFTYTLEPGPYDKDAIDEFWFDRKLGFCEHFAAAFVVTLRAAGVPARVVTGYQGGEINAVDGTFVVRQSDAHAWAEIWLAGKGWQRIDPTAASAPRRIDSGLAGALPGIDRLPLLVRSDLPWLRTLRDNLEAIDNRWNQWVLGYNPARQQALLSALGLARTDWVSLTALLAAAGTCVAGLLAAWALRQRSPADAIDRDWARFCQQLAAIGIPREPWEGPLDYARRA